MKENKTILPAFLATFIGLIIFWLITPKSVRNLYNTNTTDEEIGCAKRRYIPDPTFAAEDLKFNAKASNAIIALKAYIQAWNEGETEEELDKLNKDLLKSFGLKIKNKDIELVVLDKNNKTVLVNKII